MLNITVSGSGAGVRKYFEEHLQKEADGKAAIHRENRNGDSAIEGRLPESMPGSWGGKGAAMLGLSGKVKKEDFVALCENRKPEHPEERLTERDKVNRRPGYDFTFNAPKSVSLLVALTGDERLHSAFHQSVYETMSTFQQSMKARVRRDGESRDRITGNMVWAKFDHSLARPVRGVSDPHLHSHVFVFNATYDGAEEKWKAGQFGDLKRDGAYFEAVFHSHLSLATAKLGYEVVRSGKGWEIGGVPRDLIEKFSLRAGQVEAAAQKRGITDPKRKAELAKYTRAGKEEDSLSQFEREGIWRSRLTAKERDSLWALREASLSRAHNATPHGGAEVRHALDFAEAHCFERRSVVGLAELQAAALRAGFGILAPADVELETDRRMNQGHWLAPRGEGRKQNLITTHEVLQEEKRMVQFVKAGHGRSFPLAPLHRVGAGSRMTDEQRAAVRFIVSNRDRVFAVRGGAGTGKTTILQEAKRAVESGGRTLRAFAPTSGAVEALRENGFEGAHTVARLLMDTNLQRELRSEVLLVDEAGLLGSKTMRQIFDLAEAQNCRVLMVGDTKQHKSVERGDALRVLIEQAALDPVEVTKLQRQQAAAFREIVKDISEQKIDSAFDKLGLAGLLVEIPDEQNRHRLLAKDYLRSLDEGKTALIISPTHAEGRALTEVIREQMRATGLLSAGERSLPRLESLNWTEAERGVAGNYQSGLIVQFHRKTEDFRRGERAVVRGEDDSGRIVVERDFGPIKVSDPLPLDWSENFTVYRRQWLKVAEGDLIRVTQNGKTEEGARVNNGDVFRVKAVSARGDLLLENGRTLPGNYGHLDHGYCLTSHAAQGKTVDRTFNAVGETSLPAATRESFYVTNSRSREYTKTYTHDIDEYREAVTGERQRLSALELVGREPTQFSERETQANEKGETPPPAPDRLSGYMREIPDKPGWPAENQANDLEHDYSFDR